MVNWTRKGLRLANCGLVLATGICLIPCSAWVCTLISCFQLQYALVGVLLIMINWVLKSGSGWTLTCLICTGLLATFFVPYLQTKTPTELEQPNLKLLHWNSWRDNHSPEDLNWALDTFDPHIAFFQEVTIEEQNQFHAPGFKVEYIGDFLVVMRPEVEIAIEAHDVPWLDLPAVSLTIHFNGQLVDLFSIHPSSPLTGRRHKARNQFLQQLGEQIGPNSNPCVVIGDFNTTPFDPAFDSLLQTGKLHNSMVGFGWQPTWPFHNSLTAAMQIPIDHCLISANLQVVDRQTGSSRTSNHKPLYLSLRLKPALD
jgi:endonuclease/exonuclease/phosphatase (EEP) superfamily protein YafD